MTNGLLAWVMVLVLLPVIGFVLYLFLGQTYRKEKIFRIKKEVTPPFLRGHKEYVMHRLLVPPGRGSIPKKS